MAGRFEQCVTGCGSTPSVVNYQFPGRAPGAGGPRTHILPAGDYRLYLLADGEPTQVTLKLAGLAGETHLEPDFPAPVDLKTPEEQLLAREHNSLYAAGDSYQSGVRGLALSNLFFTMPMNQSYNFGICHYAGPTSPAPEVAYGPHCSVLSLAGAGAGAFTLLGEGSEYSMTFLTNYTQNSFPPNLDGTRGLGAWVETEGTLEEVGSHGLFVRWD